MGLSAATIGAERRSRVPVHFWIVAALSLLWNAFGAYDYVMSKLSPDIYLAAMGMDQASVAYMKAFPAWLTAFWALGVWGSLLGSVLLLVRSRHAVVAFALSLLGLAVSQGYAEIALPLPQPAPVVMVAMIWGLLVFLLVYSLRMRATGVLR